MSWDRSSAGRRRPGCGAGTRTCDNNGTATISGTPAAGSQGTLGNPKSKDYAVVITANNGVAPNDTVAV